MAFYINKQTKIKDSYQFDSVENNLNKSHTLSPTVVGSSVIALVYDQGVIIGTDTICSYYSSLKFTNVQRVEKLTDNCVYTATGEFADFQEVVRLTQEMTNQTFLNDDNISYTPQDYAHYISQLQYHYRNKMNPIYLWSVIGGFYQGKPYLAQVDPYGTYLERKQVSTGFGGYLSGALIDNNWNPQSNLEQAKQVIQKCFESLYYRDTKAHDVIQITIVDKDGIKMEKPHRIQSKWNYQGFVERANEKIHTQ
ncbi:proteasome a-type and b-type family protein, putative [Ichthyophthirius multifiliis]|uniref:Proteasome subunit beta n=1 Tax=Ichthyophthirius multifiliis TaxID=5932 RepID=G0QK59_ICHMU|nr:proteasome a-type and b-type family protein, putative [Ichthyophthirius multifiliis]EGR34390.1 proteasome a-type and b-type family protein, putative [Ichthyophthirius multifiliis]|eukprot:XP_004039694.1 proteasome a-type and b-type family protein, putative [Ichthyophthirius multifiliis]